VVTCWPPSRTRRPTSAPTRRRPGAYRPVVPLFGDIWERPGLSKRDRSLITVAALVALYRTEQLPGHLRRALDNGLTNDELIEAITHLAFYAGWPSAMTAITTLRSIAGQADKS
jgi:4-carboxymuconolactone decarboxylase